MYVGVTKKHADNLKVSFEKQEYLIHNYFWIAVYGWGNFKCVNLVCEGVEEIKR